jgi:NADPH2:quinone reductase
MLKSGFVLYTVSSRPRLMRHGIDASFQLMREGKLRLLIGDTFPIEQAADAHRSMESRQSVGKLLLIP